ncbi:hypothetical protein TTHERM_00463820 (macronuclear) [Tetrahymena thermophila SB210]|uniref:Uncharacterized protein n=1 Tax=Tetrahymena thermophila (strain SB210) TaxID=312017 RepID=Q23PQ1_TETTS|nr:hypothetical protein TTHERM_00463820 [Tetrahymena thermophila SB210]EAR98634.2 hypothetical protein TTHERM_00463820 [Tetrahymena thermophila SB210]|eukprot:XP_001018879.2 hypothetical protein TTHERM_00463820 [Tetrahymena thermophila SB210]
MGWLGSFFSKVSTGITSTFKAVKQAATTVIDTAKSGLKYVNNKINQAQNYIMNETSIGRKVKEVSSYVMKNTIIGKAVSFIGDTYQSASKILLDNPVGRLLQKGKEWFDNTSVGKFVKEVTPWLGVATTFLGGVGGVIGKVVNNVSKVKQACEGLPQKILNGITQSPVYQNISRVVKQIDRGIKQQMGGVLGKVSDKAANAQKVYKDIQQEISNNLSSISQNISTTANQTDGFLKQIDNLTTPLNQLNNFKKYTPAVDNLIKIKPKYLNLLQKEQQQIPNVSSNPLIDSYLQKFSKYNDEQKSLNKFMQTFKIIKDNPAKSSLSRDQNLNSLLQNKSIAISQINFNRNNNPMFDTNGHTIDGYMTLNNNTREHQRFVIENGQLFGCKTPNTSQHTVIKGFSGSLNPLETKQFNLQAFCADNQLSWPKNSSDYEFSNIKVRNFDENIDQRKVWDMTS